MTITLLLDTLRFILRVVADLLTFLVIARALLTWFPVRQDNPIALFLSRVTEPVLGPLRRVIPRIGMVDITPMAAVVLLQLIRLALSIQVL
ncbi:MAG: YggT family protein [Chloroflexi bacterium]|nr:YggT family protein [Chloroflexota bacterium]